MAVGVSTVAVRTSRAAALEVVDSAVVTADSDRGLRLA
jgi:hypothetical protein